MYKVNISKERTFFPKCLGGNVPVTYHVLSAAELEKWRDGTKKTDIDIFNNYVTAAPLCDQDGNAILLSDIPNTPGLARLVNECAVEVMSGSILGEEVKNG